MIFWKPLFLVKSWNIILHFLHLFCWRLLRPDYVTFVKIGSNNQNVHNSGFQNYLQISSNLYISFSQSPIKKTTLPSDTLYVRCDQMLFNVEKHKERSRHETEKLCSPLSSQIWWLRYSTKAHMNSKKRTMWIELLCSQNSIHK